MPCTSPLARSITLKKYGSLAGGVVVQPIIECAALRERTVGQVIPEFRVGARALQGFEQVVGMTRRVEFFQADEAPFDGFDGGCRDAFPVRE